VTVQRALPRLQDMSEKEWQQQVVELARALGFAFIYHTYRSTKSASGFPDLVLARDRTIYMELKREGGKPTRDQIDWLSALAHAGAEVYLVRPSDLQEIAKVLGKRWRYNVYNRSLQADGKGWTPGSLWVAGVGRWDGQCVCGEINTRHCPVHGQGGNSQDAA